MSHWHAVRVEVGDVAGQVDCDEYVWHVSSSMHGSRQASTASSRVRSIDPTLSDVAHDAMQEPDPRHDCTHWYAVMHGMDELHELTGAWQACLQSQL